MARLRPLRSIIRRSKKLMPLWCITLTTMFSVRRHQKKHHRRSNSTRAGVDSAPAFWGFMKRKPFGAAQRRQEAAQALAAFSQILTRDQPAEGQPRSIGFLAKRPLAPAME